MPDKKKTREEALRLLRQRAVNNAIKNEAQRDRSTRSPQTRNTSQTSNSSTSSGNSTAGSQRGSQSPSSASSKFYESARVNKGGTDVTDRYGNGSARGDFRGGTRSTITPYRERYKEEPRKRTNRDGYTVRGAVQQFVGGHLSSAGTALQGAETTARSYQRGKYEAETDYRLRSREQAEQRERNYLNDVRRKEGIDVRNTPRVYETDPNSFSQKLIRTGDKYIEQGSEDIERAKEGLGAVGRLGVDLGANAIQMMGDRLLAFVPGVGQALAMGSLGNRAGGTASYEARQMGMNPDQQQTYALGTSMIEMLSEGIFNSVSAFQATYGRGAFSLADKVSTRMASTKIVQDFLKTEAGKQIAINLARLGAQGFEEGVEELVADITEPALKYALTHSSGDFSMEGLMGEYNAKDMAYDFLVGALMAGIPGAVEASQRVDRALTTSQAMRDGQLSVDAKIEEGLAQQRMAESGRQTPTNAEVLARQLQEQRAQGREIQASQVNMLEDAIAESRESNARAFEQRSATAEEQAVREGTIRRSTGTEAERTAYERGETQVVDRNAERARETMGENATPETSYAVANIITGTTATNDDIETVLTNKDARDAVETLTGTQLSINNAEARNTLEDLIVVNAIANKDSIRAEAQRTHAEDIAKEVNMSKRGGKLFTEHYGEAVEALGSPMIYEEVFTRLYADGMIKDSDFNEVYDRLVAPLGERVTNYFTKDVALRAFNEGRIAMTANTAKASAREKAVKAENGNGLFVEQGAKKNVSEKTIRDLEKFAKRANVTIRLVETIPLYDENGKRRYHEDGKPMSANGMYSNGVITIASDADNKLIIVAKHELTHHIKKTAPKRYQELEDFVFKKWYHSDPKAMENKIRETQTLYQNISVEEAREEIIADASEAFFTDESAIQEVMSFSRKLGRAIHNGIHTLLDTFLALDEGDTRKQTHDGDFLKDLGILRDAEKMWAKALGEGVENRRGTKTTEEAESDEVFSIKDGKARWTEDRIDDLIKLYGASNEDYSRAYAVLMNPRDFLKLTLSDESLDEWNRLSSGVDPIKGDQRWVFRKLDRNDLANRREDAPYLQIYSNDGTMVQGHEGRHRMRALLEAGVTSVPVAIRDTDTKYSKVSMPSMTLSSQDFGYDPVNNNAKVTVKDLIPIKESNRAELIEKFGGEAEVKFSLKAIDKDYMDAVNRGDMKTAQKMVDAYAKKKGYGYKGFHGTNAQFTRFDPEKLGSKNFNASSAFMGFFASKSKETAESYTGLNAFDTLTLALGGESSAYMEKIKAQYNYDERTAEYNRRKKEFEDRYKAEHDYYEKVEKPSKDLKERMDKGRAEGVFDWMDDDSFNKLYGSLSDDYYFDWYRENSDSMSQEWESSSVAKDYTELNSKIMEEWESNEIKRRGYTPNVMPLYIKLQNPLVYDFKGEERDTESFAGRMAKAKEEGRDGCIFKNVADGGDIDDIYTVFKNTQFKSAETVTYDDNGNVIPLSERFNEANEDIRYSVKDSEGNKLTEAQRNYFKDSKVRDSNGNLLVMYHGSTENFSVFEKDKIRAVDYDAPFNGFWFTSNERNADPAMRDAKYRMKGYLNITNPAPYDVWRKLDKQIEDEWYNRAEGKGVRETARSLNDELRMRLQEMGYDGIQFDGAYNFTEENVKEYNEKGTTTFTSARGRSYDLRKSEYGDARLYPHNSWNEIIPYDTAEGFLEDNAPGSPYRTADVWVAFESNQFKLASNENPTESEDVRYSVKETETKNPNVYMLDKSGNVLTTSNGTPVAKFEKNGSVQLSLKTYEDKGRKVYKNYLNKLVKSGELSQKEADDMMGELETIYRVCRAYADSGKFAPFTAWSEADVVINEKGKPVFSSIKANSEYKMNIDFSTICKKRRTLDAVFRSMINRGLFEDLDLNKDESASLVVNINNIIRDHNFETACALCFVEARRYRQQQTATAFRDMWNGLVESMYKDKSKIEYFNFGEDDTVKAVPDGIHTMDNKDLDLSYVRKVATERKPDGKLMQTAEAKTARLLLSDPSQRKLMRIGDMMASTGFENMQVKNPKLMKIYNAKKGTGGAKSSFGDVQYLNEIISSKTFDRRKAYAVSGVRIQSFSDYVPRMVFDYVQVIADLSAKKLPAHAYTKEVLFVKQFGLTGVKINMSLVPDVVAGGKAPGLDKNGNYVWNTDGTFPYKEALAIQKADGYKENCGTIAVGISDEQIWKMLADPEIQMVIPYHKSSLNPIVAQMTNVDRFTDYTDFQNTKDADGKTVAKDFDWDNKLFELSHGKDGKLLPKSEWGDIQDLVQEYVDWCNERNYTPKFSQFLYQRKGNKPSGEFVLDENGNKIINPGYYKMLEDFALLDNEGNFKPQDDVRMNFPTDESAFGSMTDLIKQGLSEDTKLERKRSKEIEGIVDEIEVELGKGTLTTPSFESRLLAEKLSIKKDDAVQALIAKRKQKADDGEQMSFFGSLNETLPSKPKEKTRAEQFSEKAFNTIYNIRAKGSWSGKEITDILDEFPEFSFVERLNDKSDETATADLSAFLSTVKDNDDLNHFKWYFSKYNYRSDWKKSHRSGIMKFNKLIDKRSEEILAGKANGRDIGIQKRYYSAKEVRDLFNSLNTDKELKSLGEKVFDCIDYNFRINYQGVSNIDGFNFTQGGTQGVAGGRTVNLNMKFFNSRAFTDQQKAETLLHESIHTITVYAIDIHKNNANSRLLNLSMHQACESLDMIYKQIKNDPAFKGEYGTTNVYEMVAELSNPVFRAKLKAKSLFDKILNAIKKLLYIQPTSKKSTAFDMLDEALQVMVETADSTSFEQYANAVSAKSNGKYQLKTSDTVPQSYKNTIAKLEEKVADLKGEFKRTDLKTADPKQVRIQAGKLLKRHDTNMAIQGELTEAFDKIFRLYKEKDTGAFDEAYDIAIKMADRVVDNMSYIREENAEADETIGAIKDYLRTHPIVVTEEMKRNITDYGDFRKRNFGRIKLKNGDKTNLDRYYYADLADFDPDFFSSDYDNPVDMLRHIEDVFDKYDSLYRNYELSSEEMQDYVVEIASDIMETAYGLQTKKTFADKKYEEKVKAVAKAREKALASRDKALARQKERYEEKIEAIKAHNRQMAENKRARKEESETKTKLLRVMRRLNNYKTTAEMRKEIDSIIGEYDLIAKSLTGKTIEKLSNLSDIYESLKEDPDFIPDTNIENRIKRLHSKHIKDLTLEDARALYEILSNIENELRTSKKLINSEMKKEVKQLGLETMANINKSRGIAKPLKGIDRFFVNGTLSPLREIRRVTGYVDDDPLYIATKELADGQREMLTFQMNSWKAFDKFMKDKKFIAKLNGKNAEEIEVVGEREGKPYTVKITPDIRMAMYLSSLNRDNLRHIRDGGIRLPDIKLFKKGKIAEAITEGVVVRFSPSQLREITSHMTKEEKDFASEAYKFYNVTSPQAINEVSEQLKGYSIAQVDDYYPIQTDKNFLNKEFDSMKFDGTIEGMGFLKERVESSIPIVMTGLVDTLTRSIDMTSKYVGLAIPVRNFNKLYNVSNVKYTEVNRGGVKSLRSEFNGSVQDSITSKWGDPVTSYIEKFMTDIQNGRKTKDDWEMALNKWRSHYAGAVLTLNASVAMKQTASYPTAMAVTGFMPLVKAMGNIGKVDLDLIAKYTPLQWYRSQGFSTTELGDIKSGAKGSILNKVPALNWIQGMDVLTTRKLWKASEYYVRKHNKNLKQGTDEYYKAVAEIYNRVIEETQPNYTTLQRPGLLRSDSSLVQVLNMFKTQPYQNFNILYDAIGNFTAKRKQYQLKKNEQTRKAMKDATRDLRNALVSQTIQLAVFSAMTALWAMFRRKDDKYRDDEGNITIASFMERLGLDMMNSMTAEVPFGSDIYGALSSVLIDETYYGFTSVTDSSITDLLDTMAKSITTTGEWVEYAKSTEEGKKPDRDMYKDVLDVANSASRFGGIPFSNLKNLVDAVYGWGAISMDGEYIGKYEALKMTLAKDSEKKALLFRAYRNDKKAYDDLRRMMIDDGFEAEKLDAYLKKKIKDNPSKEEEANYEKSMEYLKKNSLWDMDSLSKETYEANLRKIALGIEDSDTAPYTKYENIGITPEENVLIRLAMEKADKTRGNANGYLDADEKKEALKLLTSLNLSAREKEAILDERWSYKKKG